MGRVKEVNKELGKFPYYVEMWDGETQLWRAEVRYYEVEQDVRNYPDNKSRRNFRLLEV